MCIGVHVWGDCFDFAQPGGRSKERFLSDSTDKQVADRRQAAASYHGTRPPAHFSTSQPASSSCVESKAREAQQKSKKEERAGAARSTCHPPRLALIRHEYMNTRIMIC